MHFICSSRLYHVTQIGKSNPKIYQRILVPANLRYVPGRLPDGCIVGSGSSCCGFPAMNSLISLGRTIEQTTETMAQAPKQ